MSVGEHRQTYTFRGLVRIQKSILVLMVGTLLFLGFASSVLILESSGVNTVGSLDVFWIMLIGFGLLVPFYILGLAFFYGGYRNMKLGKFELGVEHAQDVDRVKKQLEVAAVLAMVGWFLVPPSISSVYFMHPSVDVVRAVTMMGWLVSMIFTAAFVMFCGRAGQNLINSLVSPERLKTSSSTQVSMGSSIIAAIVAQVLGHAILIGYFLTAPGEIVTDIPPLVSALFFPASAVLVAVVTFGVLWNFGWFYKAATILVSNEPSPGM
jgi:hypothetical protein